MGAYYTPATYARAEDDTGGLGERLDLFFARQADRALASREAGATASRRLLDVGCGDGRFLAAMRTRGWDGDGIETDPVAADLARRRTGATVLETPIDSALIAAGSYDMVSLLHVLEHVPDPRATLLAANRALRPGGTLLLALPNIRCVEATLFGARWYPLDLPRHYWGFTPAALAQIAGECGFVEPRFRYLPFFFVPQSLRYVLRALRGRTTPTARALTAPRRESGTRTRAFRTLLGFSERLGKFVPGEVMEMVVTKPTGADREPERS